MKIQWKDVAFSLVVGAVVPWLVLVFGVVVLQRSRLQPVSRLPEQTETELRQTVSMPVRLHTDDTSVTEMDMDTYLVGVLLAEMPAAFAEEALKAQSCVARTYARKAWISGGKHGNGSVCTDPSCCQGYQTEQAYLYAGGTAEGVEKIRAAVNATSGCVLTYAGELIEATYFSCSGGRTEAAVAVWGTDYPYLQAVESPGEEQAVYYKDTLRFSASEFSELLQIPLLGPPESWFGKADYTEGGGVSAMEIGGYTFTGVELRQLLGLHSTVFSMTADEGEIAVCTKGYGHRVGMSQYGADAMARSGSSWEEILRHYYSGAEITRVS